ncbi:MAG TPA: hypothetical protein VFD71_05980, partial [Planctomycetota bacterium]|nr:hypothetical protein [Planctomycetota bacterium]
RRRTANDRLPVSLPRDADTGALCLELLRESGPRPQPLFEVPLAQVDAMSLMPGNQQFVMVGPVSEETNPLLIVVRLYSWGTTRFQVLSGL